MNRFLFAAITFAALLLTFVVDASACNRCGLFGRHCRFAHHHDAPTYVEPEARAAAPTTSNFVFNNISPPGDLSARGTTVYGLSGQLDYTAPSGALIHDNVRRALEFALQGTTEGKSLDESLAEVAKINATGRAIAEGARALRGTETSTVATSTRSIRVTIREDGTPEIVPLDAPAGIPEQAEPPTPRAGVGTVGLNCKGCHGPGAKNAKALTAFKMPAGGLSEAQGLAAKAAIEGGRMPPGQVLSDDDKGRLVLKIGKLIQ